MRQLFKFLKLLNSETGENQVAAALVCGMILGFSPGFSLQSILVFVCLFFFRVQIGAALGSAVFFRMLAYALDPVFHSVGSEVLEAHALRPLFVELYNMPIVPFTKFYNSVTMGAGVVALLLALPVFFGGRALIRKYRTTIVARFKQTKFWKLMAATSLYKWYVRYEQVAG